MRKAKNVFFDFLWGMRADNSMHDYYHVVFSFIDELKLSDELEDYMIEKATEEIRMRAYEDGVSHRPHDSCIKKSKKMYEIYKEAYSAGWRGE